MVCVKGCCFDNTENQFTRTILYFIFNSKLFSWSQTRAARLIHRPDDGGSKHLWNICLHLRDYAALYLEDCILTLAAIKTWNLTPKSCQCRFGPSKISGPSEYFHPTSCDSEFVTDIIFHDSVLLRGVEKAMSHIGLQTENAWNTCKYVSKSVTEFPSTFQSSVLAIKLQPRFCRTHPVIPLPSICYRLTKHHGT
jgi:hypothetical protein